MKYSNEWLKNEIEKGKHVEYLFFWGHTAKNGSVVDRSCFSQWYPSPFRKDGVVYATAEHWMMAKKAILFNDEEILSKIIEASKPAIAKALGREVKNFDAGKWTSASYQIVIEGNYLKFSQHEVLKKFLLQTKDKIIVEASPVDAV